MEFNPFAIAQNEGNILLRNIKQPYNIGNVAPVSHGNLAFLKPADT